MFSVSICYQETLLEHDYWSLYLALTLEFKISWEWKSKLTVIFSQNDTTTPHLLISAVAFEKSVDGIVVIPLKAIFLFSPVTFTIPSLTLGFCLSVSPGCVYLWCHCASWIWIFTSPISSRMWFGIILSKIASPQFSLVFPYGIPRWHIFELFTQFFMSPILSFLYSISIHATF